MRPGQRKKQTLEHLIRQAHDSNTGLSNDQKPDFVPTCSPRPRGVKQTGKTRSFANHLTPG